MPFLALLSAAAAIDCSNLDVTTMTEIDGSCSKKADPSDCSSYYKWLDAASGQVRICHGPEGSDTECTGTVVDGCSCAVEAAGRTALLGFAGETGEQWCFEMAGFSDPECEWPRYEVYGLAFDFCHAHGIEPGIISGWESIADDMVECPFGQAYLDLLDMPTGKDGKSVGPS